MNDNFNPQFSRMGEILIHEEKISQSELNEALAMQKTRKSLVRH